MWCQTALTPQHSEPYPGNAVYQPGADRQQPRGSGISYDYVMSRMNVLCHILHYQWMRRVTYRWMSFMFRTPLQETWATYLWFCNFKNIGKISGVPKLKYERHSSGPDSQVSKSLQLGVMHNNALKMICTWIWSRMCPSTAYSCYLTLDTWQCNSSVSRARSFSRLGWW